MVFVKTVRNHLFSLVKRINIGNCFMIETDVRIWNEAFQDEVGKDVS